MSVNVDAIVNVLAHIEIARNWNLGDDFPGHDQETWGFDPTKAKDNAPACRTSFCAGGWAIYLDPGSREAMTFSAIGYLYEMADGRSPADWAADILGLWPDDLDDDRYSTEDSRWNNQEGMPCVFDVNNTVNDLYRLFHEWTVDVEPDLTEAGLRDRVESRVADLLKGAMPTPH